MVNPTQPATAEFAFQKVFMDGEFIAGGVLNIPVKGRKPNKGARDNTYVSVTFVLLEDVRLKTPHP